MNYVLISLLILLSSCGDLNFSPYVFDPENSKVNELNLDKLLFSSGPNAKSLSNNDFSFVVLSDTHDYYDGLEAQISYINSNPSKYDFVVITGDLSNIGLQSEFEETKKRLDRLKIPYLTTIGNHDLLIDGELIYEYMFGNHTYAFDYKNTKLILFNNNNWESSNSVPDTNWVKNQLSTNPQKNTVLLSHVAPNDSARFTKSQIQDWKDLVNRHAVDYYINGHDHNPGDGTFGNSIQVTAGSSSKNVLLEMSIKDGEITHGFIHL